ncbi:hypothetical protein KQI84_10170 [bacterium]|nr:hypothetical protein [bacterium]
MPQIPTWDAMHPLIIHFPIALLMVAPLFVIAGLFFPKNGKWFHIAALSLMVLGSISTFVAASTGEAAGELAMRTPAISATLEHHEELAEKTEIVFAILTSIYALLVIIPLAIKHPLKWKFAIPSHGVFVLLYAGSLLLLVNTAHQGGMLVHEYGVHAMLPLPADQQADAWVDED